LYSIYNLTLTIPPFLWDNFLGEKSHFPWKRLKIPMKAECLQSRPIIMAIKYFLSQMISVRIISYFVTCVVKKAKGDHNVLNVVKNKDYKTV
jgi:hypothetical protein